KCRSPENGSRNISKRNSKNKYLCASTRAISSSSSLSSSFFFSSGGFANRSVQNSV
ncbi:unnamed protein product, partial [Amoebophrya sp. A120]